MKKEWTNLEVINQYVKSCNAMEKATLTGDYKSNNKEGKKLTELFKFLENNIHLAHDCLPLLLKHRNVVTRTQAAAHCLALKINIEEAEKVLEEASKDENNGIFGFNAEMTLKVWNDKGFLQVYQK